MLERIDQLPTGVIGFEAKGKLHTSDYTDVLQPAIREVLERGDDVRIVLVFETFEGLSGGAVWQDVRMGLGHLNRWKRIALVTDVEWMIHLTSLFGWLTPGEMKHFPVAQRTEAIAWAADTSSS
jgi:hypothetical protein